jgi:hypothetical protein
MNRRIILTDIKEEREANLQYIKILQMITVNGIQHCRTVRQRRHDNKSVLLMQSAWPEVGETPVQHESWARNH